MFLLHLYKYNRPAGSWAVLLLTVCRLALLREICKPCQGGVISKQKFLTARSVQFYGEEVMKAEKTLREVCATLQISRRTIQGYEKAGLVVPSGKNKYGYLLYDQKAQERIQTIRFYQQLGFSIREIQTIADAPPALQKAALVQRINALQTKQIQLHHLIQQAKQYITILEENP